MKDWEPTTARYVAYIDIMGFKDMVMRMKHDNIYKMMERINEITNSRASVKWFDIDFKLVTTTIYSDSIIIYSKDESFESLRSIVCTVSAIISDLFTEGIPHKGAIAFGIMTLDIDKSIFFGQPLIDAYLLQDEINFYGIVAHAAVEEKIDQYESEINVIPFTKNCLCNFKNGNSKHLTIYPMYASPVAKENPEHTLKCKELADAITKLRYKSSGYLRKYYDNTELYLNNL